MSLSVFCVSKENGGSIPLTHDFGSGVRLPVDYEGVHHPKEEGGHHLVVVAV